VELAAAELKEAVHRVESDCARVEDVISGVAMPTGSRGGNLARLAVLKAGFPVNMQGVQINRFCICHGMATATMIGRG
jgi:acetyl-CoA acyltransferase